jgi:hypothetical protein
MLSDWSIYLNVLHLIGWFKINEKLMTPAVTLYNISLDVIEQITKDPPHYQF